MPSRDVMAKRRAYGKYKLLYSKFRKAEPGPVARDYMLHMLDAWDQYEAMGGEQPPLHFSEINEIK